VIDRFQSRNLVPRSILAAWASVGLLDVTLDVTDIDPDRSTLIARKLEQLPAVHGAYWYRL